MKTTDFLKKYSLYALLVTGLAITSCSSDDDAPPLENDAEVITNVNDPQEVLEFKAEDPDGEGIEALEIIDDIILDANKTYNLTFEILNTLAEDEDEDKDEKDNVNVPKAKSDGDDGEDEHEHGEDIGEEIAEEDNEHQFFFSFTEGAFSNPTGNGNIDGATTGTDAINYEDQDENGNNVGLETTWTTATAGLASGKFRVKLQHQPNGIKTDTSGADDGDTDFDLEFDLIIQ